MEPQFPCVGMAKEMQRLSLAFGTGDPQLLLGPQGSGKISFRPSVMEPAINRLECVSGMMAPTREEL
jgi:ABC-type iron transport system FetAB ATPase subunit